MKQVKQSAAERHLLRLPFDQYSRQKLAYQLIEVLREDGKKFTILDVGGYKGITHQFHAHDKVTVLDVFEVEEKDYIKGDATAMTFADGSYDFVVSFDVFEHIPRDRRTLFVQECARVARRGVIIAAPIGTPQNAQAESYLNDLFRKLHGQDHQWLKEHIDYRLPEPGLAGDLMRKAGLRTFELTSSYLPYWLLMQGAIFAASKFDKVGHQIDDLYEAYNAAHFPDGSADVAQNYRIVTFGLKSEKDARAIERAKRDGTPNATQTFNDNLAVTERVLSVLVKALDDFHKETQTKDAQLAEAAVKLQQAHDDIVDRDRQIDVLQTDLRTIKTSRAYRLARKVGDVKSSITRAKKRQ